MFVNLHGYSTFSFLEAIGKPKDIAKKAKELGQSAIALTDLNVMYGAIQHYQACQDEEIKPIIGVEIGFVLDLNATVNMKGIGSIVLLAQTSQGYLNLLKLVSFASQEGISLRPKITPQLLEQYQEGLLVFCGGVESWIAKMLANGEGLGKIQEIWLMIKKILGDEKCFLEIIAQDETQHPDIAQVNQVVLELAQQTNTPCFASNLYCYPREKDKKTQELAMAIKDNLKLYDPQHRVPTTLNHIMTEEEIHGILLKNGYTLEQIASWIGVTEQIANSCEMKIQMGQTLFPNYQAEEAIQSLYEQHKEDLVCAEEA